MKSKNPKKKIEKYIRPNAKCWCCKGLGIQYFSDRFDRDQGTTCPICQFWAKEQGKKLILPFQR